ncbi:hypothetical protein CK203_037987 [Vitis vinifera]|uniref:Uncharacterized protein n=1 Tax=Vitis vinifera TaxID=29760 RepID=A0A438HNS5_VITVI|nr:hypothetical protein CK203_037987 [Vitis vinifera]
MTTHGVPSPTSIHFTIDGHHGILEARDIAEALQIPFELVDPSAFRQWSPVSQKDMIRILSKGTSTDSILLQKELPPGMLFVDVVLRSNLFPLQHSEKVHRKKLQRADTIPLLFPRSQSHNITFRAPTDGASTVYFSTYRARRASDRDYTPALASPTSAQLVPMPEAVSAAPPLTPTIPSVAPTTSEPSITISASEFHAL